MSIATDMKVKDLFHKTERVLSELAAIRLRLDALEKNIIEGDGPDYEELSARYEAKFGKPPHHRMLPETLERALRE